MFLQPVPCAARSSSQVGLGMLCSGYIARGHVITGSSSSEAQGLTASTKYSYVFRLFSAYVHPGVDYGRHASCWVDHGDTLSRRERGHK